MKRVIVVGAGPGGLAFAAALRHTGTEVVIIERQPVERIVADAGGAYELTAKALGILEALGAGDAVRRRGVALSRFELRACSETVLQTLDFRAAGFEVFSITRSELQRALWERLDALGCTTLAETQIDTLEETEHSARVTLSNGKVLEADFVIGADGMHSGIRRLHFDPEPPIDVGITAWWGQTPVAALTFPLERGQSLGYLDPGRSFVLAHGGRQEAPTLLWTVCATAKPGEAALALIASAFPEPVQHLIAHASSTAQTRILEQRPLTRWATRRTLLIGDAAHGMAPFLGLGANSAIEDAFSFAAALGKPTPALAVTAQNRLKAMNPRIAEARRIGRLMHSRNRLVHALFRALTWTIPSWLVLRGMRARHRPL